MCFKGSKSSTTSTTGTKVTSSGGQWSWGGWVDCPGMPALTAPAAQAGATVTARGQWGQSTVSAEHQVRVVRVGNPYQPTEVIATSNTSSGQSGYVTATKTIDVAAGDEFKLQIWASRGQSGSVVAPNNGIFGWGASPGTYLEVA